MSTWGTGWQRSWNLFERDGVAVGRFSWDARRAGMRRDSHMDAHTLIAVPTTAVRITQTGRGPVIADSCTAILYNPHQRYVAEQLLDNRPEETIWLAMDHATFRGFIGELDERLAD